MQAVDEQHDDGRRPNSLMVLALLMTVALVFSWLCAYALAGAMVTAELLPPWAANADPRPRWLLGCFAGLMTLFGAFAIIARHLSRRQLQRIDAMADDDQDNFP